MRWTLSLMLAAGVSLAALAGLYAFDMQRAYRRLAVPVGRVHTPWGEVEYTSGGAGLPVLVVHGSGGGHDQGELIAQAMLGEGFRWIAPSRFGYLGSTLPPGAGFAEQADVFAALLDHLGLARVAVVAMSHGGPSALQLAIRHPQRVGALVLLSCGVASSADADQRAANRRGDALATVFRHDPLYWAISRFLRRPLTALMGADAELVAALPPQQRHWVDEVIERMNPVEPRSAGVMLDHLAALPDGAIASIPVPTLVVHARDDGLQRFRNAEYAAATIPGARLSAWDRGGHLLIAVEQPAVRTLVQDFLCAAAKLDHPPRAQPPPCSPASSRESPPSAAPSTGPASAPSR